MSRCCISLFVVLSIAAVQGQQVADACGVKIAIKKVRMPRNKPTPVNSSGETVVDQRRARTPIAAGPAPQQPPRRVVEAKASDPKPAAAPPPPTVVAAAQPPAPPPPTPAPQPERIVAAEQPPPESAKPQPKTAAVLHDEVFFTVGNSTLAGTSTLDRDVRWLTANPDAHAVVEGYADPTGTHDGNMELSRSRAESVRNYFTAAGIDASRLEVVPYGDTKLKYGRTDGRNRRVAVEAKK